MSKSKSIILNSSASLIQQIVSLFIGLVLPRAIIIFYGSAANGTISSISQFISIITLFQGGINSAARVAFYGPVSNNDIDRIGIVYNTSKKYFIRFAIILAIYIVILGVLYSHFIKTPFSTMDLFFLVLIIGIQAIMEYLFGMANQLLLFADQKSYVNTILQTVAISISALISLVLIYMGFSIIYMKFIATIVLIIRPVALNIYVKNHYSINKKAVIDDGILNQSRAALSKSIAYYIHKNTDNVVITSLMSVSWVSVYAVHAYVSNSVSNMVSSILGNTEAYFGKLLSSGSEEEIEHDVPIYDLMSKIVSSIAFFVAIILINSFVSIYTSDIRDINYSYPIFAIMLCVSEYIYCMSLTYNNMIMASGHIKQTQWISILESIINIVFSLLLVKEYGIIGVTIGTLVAFVFNSIANIIYMRKKIYDLSLGFIIKTYAVNIITGTVISVLFFWLVRIPTFNIIIWGAWAVLVLLTVTISIIFSNYIFFNDISKEVLYSIRNKLLRKG